jgi:hypothetical protein
MLVAIFSAVKTSPQTQLRPLLCASKYCTCQVGSSARIELLVTMLWHTNRCHCTAKFATSTNTSSVGQAAVLPVLPALLSLST